MRKYKKILFCTDFSELADVAFDYACDFAQKNKSKLHILHVSGAAMPNIKRLNKKFQKKYLKADSNESKCEGEIIKVECVVRKGLGHEQIVGYAKDKRMDLIVMGTHGKSGFFKDVLIGSCARQVVRTSSVPVFVVPAPERSDK